MSWCCILTVSLIFFNAWVILTKKEQSIEINIYNKKIDQNPVHMLLLFTFHQLLKET